MAGEVSFDDLIPKAAKTPGEISFDDLTPKKPTSLVDALRSIPGGLAKGAAAMAGIPGDIRSGMDAATIYALKKTGLAPEDATPVDSYIPSPPTSRAIADTVASPFGGFYKPQTKAGQYAETISSFAPAALAPGGIPARIARVVVPGAASEAAGQATAGSWAEPYARTGAALVGAGAVAAAPKIGDLSSRMYNRAVSAMGGKEFLDPNVIATQRLASAAGGAPAATQLNQDVTDWQQTGASGPSLIDVGGNRVRRLVRAAASGATGNAQDVAQVHADQIAGNLQERAVGLASDLTPGGSDAAAAYNKSLADTQGKVADTTYRAPYAEPAAVTPDMVSALQGNEGRKAIGRAMTSASANRNTQQMGELRDLLSVAGQQSGGRNPLTGRMQSLEDALQNLSAGSLDRVRIAMRDIGREWYPKSPSIAAGYKGRVSDIDTALDQTPGLQPARATYRGFEARKSALELGQDILKTPSNQYGAQLGEIGRNSIMAPVDAGVGARDSIVNAIESPAEGSTGLLNKLATSNRTTANLGATFGEGTARRFQSGIGNEIDRLTNARYVSPNTGSQTALRANELSLVDAIPTSKLGVMTRAIGAMRNGLTLTDAQRETIVRLGTDEGAMRRVIASMPGVRSDHIARQLFIAGQASTAQRAQ